MLFIEKQILTVSGKTGAAAEEIRKTRAGGSGGQYSSVVLKKV